MVTHTNSEQAARGESGLLVRICLVGLVNDFELARQLGGAIRPGPDRYLLVDCLEVTDYSPEARQLFIDWNRAHVRDIDAVAVLTENPLWHLVVSATALACGQRMKAFGDETEAMIWLGRPKERSMHPSSVRVRRM